MTQPADRCRTFRQLHESGCFIVPNPWDLGSARLLAQLGFRALATTSSGLAWSLGRPDNHVTLEATLAHLRAISQSVGIPVSADFEGGFATAPEAVGANVAAAATTGIAGLSIEDSTGDASSPLHDFSLAVERIKAARRAIEDSGTGIVLTGRSEGFIAGRPDLSETIRRLTAFAEAGADCLYAPGVRDPDEIKAIVREVSPKPVNVLAPRAHPAMSLSQLADLGVRRVSVGSALSLVAWGAFIRAAKSIAETGSFEAFADAAAYNELNDLFNNPG